MRPLLQILFGLIFSVLMVWAQISVAQNAPIDPHPLRPADTSSPRDTLKSFDEGITKAIVEWRSGQPYERYRKLGLRAMETFDYSQLSGSGRAISELEDALFLKEILDRISLPPYDEIPGDENLQEMQEPLSRWTIPDTRISIVRVPDGPRAGEYLFSNETVGQLREFYAVAKSLPYKPGALINSYNDYMTSPGSLMPVFIARQFPDWSKNIIFGETLWQWTGVALGFVILFFVVRWLLKAGHRWDRVPDGQNLALRFSLPIAVLLSIAAAYGFRTFVLFALRLGGEVRVVILTLVWVGIFFGLCWFVLLFLSRLAEVINMARKVREGSIDGQMLKTLLRLAGVVTIIALVIVAASFFGIPMTPVLASLGVGGLAVALAVRPTLENIIGGLILFADKPVRIGDKCEFGGQVARVEEIGLRSTRLRRLDGRVVTVPNADFSQRELINHDLADYRVYSPTVQLGFDTASDQLRLIISKLYEMLKEHPRVSPDVLSVRFRNIGNYSLNVEVFAYLLTRDWIENAEIQEDLNFKVLSVVNSAGAALALPMQRVHIDQFTRSDSESGSEEVTG